MEQKTKDAIRIQAGSFGLGAAAGALTHHASKSHALRGELAATIGSAVGAAASTGAGVSGAATAGLTAAGLGAAKAAAVVAFGGPVAVVAGVAGASYGIYKLFKKLTD